MGQPNAIDQYVGQKLCDIRKQAGWSRVDLAAAIGVDPERLCQYEAGLERIPAALILQLSKTLRFDIGEFFAGIELGRKPAPSEDSSESQENLEATALLRDFLRIRDRKVRSLVLSLVAAYAENGNAREG